MAKLLKMMAINNGPKEYSRLAHIGEYVEIRNLDSSGVMVDIRITDYVEPHSYIGVVVRVHGQIEGIYEGDEVQFPQACVFRCFDEAKKRI